MDRSDLAQLAKPKYQFPKYAVKMATGTGKTWVMHALLIWQMLNARHEEVVSGRFTQKFLIVAPGLIVYDRLLDAFCGRKKRDEEYRDPQTNDYYMNQDVFIPERYRDEVFSFIQNNVVTKEDGIGRKTTGEGLIALTNWHLFENQMEEKDTDEEWKEIKAKLFDIDHYKSPKVVISVLMLREGFDVNNICVLVPLRSSQAPILLEQLVGRGLRLMWRESDYTSIKYEDRQRVLRLHKPPKTFIDTLSIVEHPAFIKFYDDLQEQGLVAVDEGEVGAGGAMGDIITVGLKENYENYDFQWPVILHDSMEELEDAEIDLGDLDPFTMYPLDLLRKFLAKEGETFVSQESLTKTTFGKYKVTANLFNANGYNEYLQKLLRVVTLRFENCRRQGFPTIQINEAQTVQVMDWYIRTRLFAITFDPFHGSDWKILLAKDGIVTKHIVEQFARAIYKMQNRLTTIDAEVTHTPFSSLQAIKMRESYSMEVSKCIYPRLGYPSHGGGLEKTFIEFLDRDAEVERFLKINESGHTFAIIFYVRKDGLMATYHPDFIVATAEKVYLIETKGDDKVDDANVRQKQTATIEWIKKVNALDAKDRMNRTWEYVLIGESVFYSLSGSGATITDICNQCKVSYSMATGNLFE